MEQISKKEQARQIYVNMMMDGQHPVRKDVIKRFKEEIGLTDAGSATYQNNFKTGTWSLSEPTGEKKVKKEKDIVDEVTNNVQQMTTMFSKPSTVVDYNPDDFDEINVGDDDDRIEKLTGSM